MTNPVERVARAICLADGLNPVERIKAGSETLWRWEINVPRARAAIAEYKAALKEDGLVVVPREPTEGMVEAGEDADEKWEENDFFDPPFEELPPKHLEIWQAMIDKAPEDG